MKRIALVLTVAVTAACENSSLDPSPAPFSQVDYIGRPAISTVFIPSTGKDAYNASVPADHRAMFMADVTGFLMTVAGYTQQAADGLANVLLPDILTVDLAAPSGYLNGRLPADDVTTASLMLVFGPGTPVSDDNVDANDKPYPSTFPYIATPHLQ